MEVSILVFEKDIFKWSLQSIFFLTSWIALFQHELHNEHCSHVIRPRKKQEKNFSVWLHHWNLLRLQKYCKRLWVAVQEMFYGRGWDFKVWIFWKFYWSEATDFNNFLACFDIKTESPWRKANLNNEETSE